VWADTIGGGAPSEHGHCLIPDVLVHLQVVYGKYLDLTDEPVGLLYKGRGLIYLILGLDRYNCTD
jgi:hypothetical protein